MAAPQKKRLIYWWAENVTDQHRAHATVLSSKGFQVRFIGTVEGVLDALQQQRVSIIIVDDAGPSHIVSQQLKQLLSTPEVQGVRLILSVIDNVKEINMIAACSAFRDLIPLNLDEKQWFTRFVFATARSPVPISETYPQVSLNHIANLAIPARMIWVSDRRILFEAKMRPSIGSTFTLKGPFTEALGLRKISLTVEECRKSDLIFRFSDAVIARWNVPSDKKEAASQLLSKMRQTDFGPRCKVFLAIQDRDLRAQIVRDLDPLRFEVNIALQKRSIIDEPKFFSPQIVFIEDRFCMGEELERFKMMLDNLSAEVPIFVLGSRAHIRQLQRIDPIRKITLLNRIPDRLTDVIFTKFLPPNHRKNLRADEDAVNITPDHPFSMVEIHSTARLTRLHPHAAQMAIPINLGSYGLCKIESPIVTKLAGFSPYAKIIESYPNQKLDAGTFANVIECYLSNITKPQQRAFATELTQYVSEALLPNANATKAIREEPVRAVANASFQGPSAPPIAPVREVARDRYEPEGGPDELDVDEVFNKIAESTTDVLNGFKGFVFSRGLRHFLMFLAISVFVFVVVFTLVSFVEPNWKKSGRQYDTQLRKFAPDKYKKVKKPRYFPNEQND